MTPFREIRASRLADETGTLHKQADLAFALCYPSPYHLGMSSLGFQSIYRSLHALPDSTAERAFLPDNVTDARRLSEGLCTYESGRSIGDFAVVAFSLASELELAGVVSCLDLAGIPALHAERASHARTFPLVVVGGPLTFSNPVPVGPFADVVVMGEAEELLPILVNSLRDQPDRETLLNNLAHRPGFYLPSLHGETPPPVAIADDNYLPAYSQIVTPHTELGGMFLIEAERGCSRGCAYCVMRRSAGSGMRPVAPERLLSLVPAGARRVGLVGAAVADHPALPEILRALVDAGREVGVSSLRADRLDDELVGLLARGGYRTLTTAADGASQRLRDQVDRHTRVEDLLRAARLCRDHGMALLKLYVLIGLPGETAADIDELARLALELAALAPKLSLTVSPFVSKRNTPLDHQPFEDIASLDDKLAFLRRQLRRRVRLGGDAPKWGWVEYRLAQGGFAEGLAAARAARAGGGFAAWKRALAE
jgi:Fe-S oxidoreductase